MPTTEPVPIDRIEDTLLQGARRLNAALVEVETVLGQSLANGQARDGVLDHQTMRVLQKLDYARQYSKDLCSLLNHISGMLEWTEGATLHVSELEQLVDMAETLSPAKPEPKAEVVAGDPDLWL